MAGPTDNEWLAEAPLVFTVLAPAERAIHRQSSLDGLGNIAAGGVGDPTVVARENDERVVCKLEAIERVEQLADAPVELVDEVSVAAEPTPLKPRIGHDRPMDGVRGEVEKERVSRMCLNPAGGLRGQSLHDVVWLE